jgi:cobalt-zinc-cadmium efflux system outer membrane protein
VAIAKSELNRQCARRVPNFNIEGGILYNNGSQQAVASAGLSTPLQLYDRNQGNIMAAQSDLVRAQQEVRRMELALQHRLADVFREYINAREQVRRYREELLPDAKSNLELVQQGYRQGEFGYLELLTGQRTFFRVNLAYVESLQDLSISSTRIEGLLLTGGLEKPR